MVKANNWRSLFSSSFVLLFPPLINLVYSCCKFAYASDTLLPGQFLDANHSLVSKNGAFKLGFACSVHEDDYNSCCGLGIWFAKPSSCNREYFPVWQPGQYACEGTTLSLTENGVLNLTASYGDYWYSSNMWNTSVNAAAVLLDNGNLVIRDQANNSMVIWQSFDSPTNVLLSGGLLGLSKITCMNITLYSYSDYVFAEYTLSLDATRRRGFIIQRTYDGLMFTGTFPRWMDIREDGHYALTFNDARTYIQLNSSGFVTFYKQGECDTVLWSAPDTLCDYDSYCGPYGLCTRSGSCICPVGFDPPYTQEWNIAGCSRKEPLNCEKSIVARPEVTFYPIHGIHRYPQHAFMLNVSDMSECESSCLRDCTCSAFAYNTSCLLWFSDLRNTLVLDSGPNGNHMYIRIATKQQSGPRTVPLVSFWKRLVFGSMLALVVIGLILLWRCRRKLFRARTVVDNGSLVVFSFVQIKNCTKNFSEKLGEGGFGCVFKGMLPGCTAVAVKKLKGLRQEDKQFRAEVQTIGMIQHINIVRLLGFCAEDSRRFLVYEYMANGSLSNHLFSKRSSKLSWELRYSIALGIAGGLAYLHEGCRDCIVHCDMKPDNILLDAELCPKIADFGMAKLLCRDFSRALTTMRGTIGYLAPEWISGLPITHKADVYSYGMVLLEIIAGRRNSEKIKEGKFTYFPIYAAVKVNEGDVMCLLDSSLEGNAEVGQLNRTCRVACWCIQDAEDHRPMMGQVVRMLEGVMDVEVPPVPRSLQNYVGIEDSISEDLNISISPM
ncbi:hypothetical protein SETIT_5G015900v2 [Setaria italica]|uniref:Receptor-like serine/threonine-protein kinase n=1 Tax=Setaria italica TaxID=4555 RepID=A0A368R030_SETIT|nr:hypothetical protein SETIT_5G015900v2 [Setaria italica]